jgi:hypothetical protein
MTHISAMQSTEGPSKMALSSATHNESSSCLKRLFNDSYQSEVILYSDGSLIVKQESTLVEKPNVLLNLSEVRTLTYYGGRYRYRTTYKLLNLVSAICGIISLVTVSLFMEKILEGTYEDSIGDLFAYLVPVFTWLLFDLNRGRLASPEYLKFIRKNGTEKKINGKLPDAAMFEIGTVGVVIGLIFAFFIFIDWIIWAAPLLADIILYGILVGVALLLIWKLKDYFLESQQLETIDAMDIPNGITHMYFAAMATNLIQENEIFDSKSVSGEINKNLAELKEKLESHDEILSSILSAQDIFRASSASIGVIAIRASTELLMKEACERKGSTWKPSARPTLESYIQWYNSKENIQARIRGYLDYIKNIGNRANHVFDIDSKEFMGTLQMFCDVVEWYAEIFAINTTESE